MSAVETATPETAPPGANLAAPPPLVTGTPVELADGVFVIPDGRASLVPNVGVVVGDRAALVIDSGLGPRSGAAAHRIARDLAGDRPLLLTLTHFHPEHGFGAQAFGGATLLYNRVQHEEFLRKRERYLQQFRGLSPAVAAELDGVAFVDPHVVYDGAADLDLGGKVVQLQAVGPAHSRGDQIAFLPAERILFTGDLVEDRFYPIFPFIPPHDVDVDGNNWILVLEKLQRLGPRVVVPGHGEVGDVGLIATWHGYMTLLRSETKRLAGEGMDADAIVATLGPRLRTRYPDWEASEPWRVAMGVQTFLAQ